MFRAMYEVIEFEVQRETEQLFLSCLLSLFHLGGTILELGKVYSTLPPIGYLIRLLAFSL